MEAGAWNLASGWDPSSGRQPRFPAEQIAWIGREDGRFESVDRRFVNYTGQPADRLLGLGWREAIHPDDGDRCLALWRQAAREGEGLELEFRVRARDGRFGRFLGRAEPLVGDDGRPGRWVGTAVLLDGRVAPPAGEDGRGTGTRPAVEEADRARAEGQCCRLSRLVEHWPDFVGLADLDGGLNYLNAAARRMIGLGPRDDPGGLGLGDLDAPEHRGRSRDEVLPAVLRLGYWQDEARIRHLRTGSPIDVSRSTFLVRDPRTGEPSGLGTVSRDVTGEKRARDQLRESRRFIDEFTALLPSILYLFELRARRHIYLNREVGTAIGYSEAEIAADADGFLARVMHPGDAPGFERHLRRLESLPDGRTAVVEYRLRHRDGSWRWFQGLDAAFRREPDGRVREVIGVATDITDRRRAEAAQREGEHRLRTLAEAGPSITVMLDSQGRTGFANSRWEQYVGVPFEEASRALWAGTIHPDDYERAVERWWSSVALGETFEVEGRLRRRDGQMRWHLARFVPVRDDGGGVTAWCGTITEIHQIKEAERALRESERRFKAMADSAPAVLWVAEPDGRCSFLSQGWYESTGQDPGGGLGLGWLDAVHPDDRDLAGRIFLDALGRREPFQVDYRLRAADGSYRWATDLGRPRFDDDGRFLGYVGSVIDVAERKEAEQQAAEARLLAEAASRAKSEFLANMSHEIRTPMTAILGYADVLARQVADPDDLQCVETIRRNGDHLIGLINDILDLSKIEAGRVEVERHRFEPDRLVAEVCSLMDVRAREKGLRLEVEAPGPLPETVESDPTRLRQVLVNLVGNAIKFTESGEVRVVVRLEEDDPAAPRLRFEVADTGIGIAPEQADRLFRPFTQGDSSMTRLYGGSGLGLVICRRLVELLGGEISVESAPGRGSRFAFTVAAGPLEGVPRVAPRTGIDAAAPPEEEGPPRRLSCLVLVADDRPDIRSLARMYLEDAGARVKTAEDGEAAIAALRRAEGAGTPFDVVVMDMQMPRLDGYSAVSRLRAEGYARPVLALTASAMRGDRERCLASGCTEYLPKPIDRRLLVDLVGRLADLPPSASASARPATSAHPPRQGGLRVLIVDDSPDICRVTSRLLGLSGHEVRSAGDGRSALEMASGHMPEVVLLDLGLPDMDGLDLVRHLKAIDGLRGSTFIAVTGRDRREDRELALAAGFDHVLVKPVDIDTILALFPAALASPR